MEEQGSCSVKENVSNNNACPLTLTLTLTIQFLITTLHVTFEKRLSTAQLAQNAALNNIFLLTGRFGYVLREHDHRPIRSASARGVGSSEETALHVARSVREIGDLPALPCRHVGRGARRFRRRQCRLLDADSSG